MAKKKKPVDPTQNYIIAMERRNYQGGLFLRGTQIRKWKRYNHDMAFYKSGMQRPLPGEL